MLGRISGIQGWCEAGRFESECAGCGNAEGLRWFCGNPEDALTADQWVELGLRSTSEVSSGFKRVSWHGFRVFMSMPEPGERWEERVLDEGAYCDASQVRVPCL